MEFKNDSSQETKAENVNYVPETCSLSTSFKGKFAYYDNFFMDLEPISHLEFEAILSFISDEDDCENLHEIGNAKIYAFKEVINTDLLNIGDSISEELEEVISSVINRPYFDLLPFDKFAVLSNVMINKEYRNKGLATHLINKTLEFVFKGLDIPMIYLKAYPFGEEMSKQEKEKQIKYLMEFYKSFGFKPFGENLMYMSVDEFDLIYALQTIADKK